MFYKKLFKNSLRFKRICKNDIESFYIYLGIFYLDFFDYNFLYSYSLLLELGN